MWIFGYGSLVWKADFPYAAKIVGYVKGYERKFYQASIDHRGVPENPGRVVTLIPSVDPEAKVWGIAYEIDENDTSTLNKLFSREKRYHRKDLDFHPAMACSQPRANMEQVGTKMDFDSKLSMAKGILPRNSFINVKADSELGVDFQLGQHTTKNLMKVTVFTSDLNGSLFLGEASPRDIALQIASAKGPSGSNSEYLLKLAQFMKTELPGVVDTHLFDIEKELLNIIDESN